MRGLGFVPLIATTALATGVYAVARLYLCFMRYYLSPNPMVAAVLGAVVISAEVLLLRSIGKWLGRYPSVRNASDNIRNAMNMLMEVALLVGRSCSNQNGGLYRILYRGCHLLSTNHWAVGTENGGTGRGSNDHRHPAECSLLAWPVRSRLRKAPMKTFPSHWAQAKAVCAGGHDLPSFSRQRVSYLR